MGSQRSEKLPSVTVWTGPKGKLAAGPLGSQRARNSVTGPYPSRVVASVSGRRSYIHIYIYIYIRNLFHRRKYCTYFLRIQKYPLYSAAANYPHAISPEGSRSRLRLYDTSIRLFDPLFRARTLAASEKYHYLPRGLSAITTYTSTWPKWG